MADSTQTVRIRCWCRLIRFLGLIVPARLRADWRQEWEAELHWRAQQLAAWDKLDTKHKLELWWHSVGAFADALWLQPKRWEDEMIQDIRFGLRMLRKNPGFTLLAMLTLGAGIGANTAIFSLLNGVLWHPLPYGEPERLVRVFHNLKERNLNQENFTAPDFLDWRAQQTSFEAMAAYQARGFDLTGRGEAERVPAMRASASLLSLLRINPMLGRNFTTAEEVTGKGQVALLSYRLWQERFDGAKDALGKSLTLDGNSYEIIGVLPAAQQFPGFINADVWVPMAFEPFELENRGGHNYQGIARLKPGVTLAQAQAEMSAIAARLGQQYDIAKGWGVTLVSLQEQITGKLRKPLFLLFGAVGLVLLIACANVANLLLARAAAREREFAVRTALGAGRMRIVRQLLLESGLLGLGGAVLGGLFSYWTVAAVVGFGAETLPRLEEVRLNGQVFGFTLGLALLTSLLFGLAPAWMISRTNLNATLKDAARGSTQGRRQRFRAMLVVTQIALAVVLLIGASLLLRSFGKLRTIDFGFQPERLLTATLTMSDKRFPGRDAQRMAFLSRLVERTSMLPGVESASSVMGLPLSFLNVGSAFYFDDQPMPNFSGMLAANYSQISANYFQTMQTSLLKGRAFELRDNLDAPFVAIVNEAFVRKFSPNEELLGKRLRVMDSERERPTEIVGIVRDMQQVNYAALAEPMMYFPATQRCWADAQLVLRTHGDPAAMKQALRRAVNEIDAAQTIYQVRTFDELMGNALAQQQLQMTLLVAFASIALLLAAVGIYGVMASSVTQRTHELGVRLTLGAQPRQMLRLILRQGLGLTMLGIAFGVAAAWGLTRWLSSLLYEISPTDFYSFIIMPLLLFGVALLACWWPARHAAKVDPLVALRHE